MREHYYVTTPIYYVNDRPHLGHLYTSTIADILARFHRLSGRPVFLLTGVDEHAAKVEFAAAERGISPQAWADENAAAFLDLTTQFDIAADHFVRTSADSHKTRVAEYISALISTGDVYRGEYIGWYDAGQEEYVAEQRAQELEYRSPFSGTALVRRSETNYFFRLSAFQQRVIALIESGEFQIAPDTRREEVLARLRGGLNDVPISRPGSGWGIPVPDDPTQTIYVWIDALFSYFSSVDAQHLRAFWPADTHIIGKDILWFHAVLWPALLLALGQPLPKTIYVHSLWLRGGRKMSKSLGNGVDRAQLDAYVQQLSLDGLRWFLASRGPIGGADTDFSEAAVIDSYNADLANTLGNCSARVLRMIGRYFDHTLPARHAFGEAILPGFVRDHARGAEAGYRSLDFTRACRASIDIVRGIDREIERLRPFALAKDLSQRAELGGVLYACAEALRAAAVLMSPIIPSASAELQRRLGGHERATAPALTEWGQLVPGSATAEGPPLFPRLET